MSLILPTLSMSTANDINSFIGFWQTLYSYKNEALYTENLNVEKFSSTNIQGLFIWKNGTPLSGLKKTALDNKIINKLTIVNQFRESNSFPVEDFNQEFKSVSAVWRIYLLHIIKPKNYPIYDQHIHRAHQFFNGLESTGITNKLKEIEKTQFYFDQYLPFVRNLNVGDLKKMDEAFFAFGQFLNTGNYRKLVG